MTAAVLIGLAGGLTLGLCVAPLWMMLQLPARIVDICDAGSMRMSALALALGAAVGALSPTGCLPMIFAVLAMGIGGIFVGMMASALVEVLEVVPALYDRLSVSSDMRLPALALAAGKFLGALLTGFLHI